jgi:hypothetical protein
MSEVSMHLSEIGSANAIRQRLDEDVAKYLAKGGKITVLPINARTELDLPLRETHQHRKQKAFGERIIKEGKASKRAAK